MKNHDRFFIRDPWVYKAEYDPPQKDNRNQGFCTRSLHAGFHPMDHMDGFRTFVPPIVPSMTYPYKTFDKIPCPVYGRTQTPTNAILEKRLASLEGGEACITAGSGSQALFNLIFTIARPGDNGVTSLNVFGEGYKQAASIFPERCHVEFRFVSHPENMDSWASQIDKNTKLLWVETPSNPCLFITDIQAVADIAHDKSVPLMVDNTTATAALQQPMELGADIVLLSTTKFLAGNATVLGGAVIGPESLVEDIRWNTTEFVGSIIQPMEAWLLLQFLETLPLRMDRHSENARLVAEFLNDHPKVEQVNYPGLAGHPQYELAKSQMKSNGGLLSFVVKNGVVDAAKLMNSLKLVVHAVTFGTSKTICMHPPTITHEHMTPEERASAGIDDGLIRLSVGLEDPEDIIADLEHALDNV